MRTSVLALPLLLALSLPVLGGHLFVTPQHDGTNVLVSLPTDAKDGVSVGISGPGLRNRRIQVANGRLHFILPKATAGKEQHFIAGQRPFLARSLPDFQIHRPDNRYLDVSNRAQPVMRFDAETSRLYLHNSPPKGRPRHLVYLGWSETTFKGKTFDTWTMAGAQRKLTELPPTKTGPILGEIAPRLSWQTNDGTVFLEEQRSIIAYHLTDALYLDIDTTLKAPNGEVTLGGAPASSGLHLRLYQAQDAKALPLEKGTEGWAALACKLQGQDFYLQHMTHPSVPKGRQYLVDQVKAHLGAPTPLTIKAGESQRLRYRLLIAKGQMPAHSVLHLNYLNFAKPPKVVERDPNE